MSNGRYVQLRPLHYAARNGNPEIIKLLLDSGAHVNAEDSEGWTALHHASYHGHRGCVELLLDRGADINCRTKQGLYKASALQPGQEEGEVEAATEIDMNE